MKTLISSSIQLNYQLQQFHQTIIWLQINIPSYNCIFQTDVLRQDSPAYRMNRSACLWVDPSAWPVLLGESLIRMSSGVREMRNWLQGTRFPCTRMSSSSLTCARAPPIHVWLRQSLEPSLLTSRSRLYALGKCNFLTTILLIFRAQVTKAIEKLRTVTF